MNNRRLSEVSNFKSYFLKHQKKVMSSVGISFLFVWLAAGFAGLKLFYPYHFIFSVLSLVLAAHFLIRSFFFNRKVFLQSGILVVIRNLLFKHKFWVVIGVLLGIGLYLLWTVIPQFNNPFKGMDEQERRELIQADVEVSTVLLDNLELAAQDLMDSPLLKNKTLTAEERRDLQGKWNLFLSVAIESEKITDVHRYFNQINIFAYPKEHAMSFIISYSLYIKKFEIFHRLIEQIGNNEAVIKQLNEYSPVFGSKDSYDDVLDRFFHTDSLTRRNLGRMYALFLGLVLRDDTLDEGYFVLEEESVKSHSYLLKKILNTTVYAVKEKRYRLEKDLSEMWFPVQKNVANIMGESYVSSRHDKLISLEQIVELKKSLEPGDILLERRNWYASNVGIPGFWAHAALYVGTVDDMDEYFKELFPREGHQNLKELLEKRHLELFEQFKKTDSSGYPYAVIEGKSPGIILQSLEESARADYLGVLRPRLTKVDKLESILRAFENHGKPYDYNFDFETRDEIVCSELIYDAYQSIGQKKGLQFELTLTAGRKIVSPNDMVKKYYKERGIEDRELDFVYFIDGNEELKKAFVKDESMFANSWNRPKYSWFQE